MAKIGYWQFPEEWLPLIKKILQWNDRFFTTSVRSKRLFISVKRKDNLTARSLQAPAALAWQLLTLEEKNKWAEAASLQSQTSFQLFLQEYAASLRNDIEVPTLPSDFAQNNVGRAVITFPGSGFLLMQEHPFKYEVLRKVTGTRDQYQTVELREDFAFPFEIGLSYRTDLEPLNLNAQARFLVEVLSHYQGSDIVTAYEIDIPLVSDWDRQVVNLPFPIGLPKQYNAFIDVQNCQGIFEWDNVLLYHSGQNWARDFRCNNVRTNMTRAFQKIAKHWSPEIVPPGVFYDSVYYRV